MHIRHVLSTGAVNGRRELQEPESRKAFRAATGQRARSEGEAAGPRDAAPQDESRAREVERVKSMLHSCSEQNRDVPCRVRSSDPGDDPAPEVLDRRLDRKLQRGTVRHGKACTAVGR